MLLYSLWNHVSDIVIHVSSRKERGTDRMLLTSNFLPQKHTSILRHCISKGKTGLRCDSMLMFQKPNRRFGRNGGKIGHFGCKRMLTSRSRYGKSMTGRNTWRSNGAPFRLKCLQCLTIHGIKRLPLIKWKMVGVQK